MIYWEDADLGVTRELGTWTFTEEEIIQFAKLYDPQPFHTDPVFAASHEFGGLVASGFHVTSIWMKLMIESRHDEMKDVPKTGETNDNRSSAAGISPGFKKLRWLKPVRPGDTLSYSTTSWRRVPMGSRTDVGIIQSKSQAVNQHGEMVMTFIGQGLMPRRPQDQ